MSRSAILNSSESQRLHLQDQAGHQDKGRLIMDDHQAGKETWNLLRILVAGDTVVNQKFARLILQKAD